MTSSVSTSTQVMLSEPVSTFTIWTDESGDIRTQGHIDKWSRDHAVIMRDWLNDWLERHPGDVA